MMTGLERAIGILGGQSATAKVTGIPQSTIWNWLHLKGRNHKKGEPPPNEAKKISVATEGEVPPWELCPDHFKRPDAT